MRIVNVVLTAWLLPVIVGAFFCTHVDAAAETPTQSQAQRQAQDPVQSRTQGLAQSPTQLQEYLLGSGDSVRVTVYNNADLTTEAQIAADGTIPFPLLGRVKIGGLTKAAAEAQLAKLLIDGNFLRQAAVNLAVTDYRSQQVSVLGEVGHPGKYPISAAMTITDVIAQAGGITATGSRHISIVQRDAAGKSIKREIDLDRLLGPNGSAADLSVHNGDLVYVAAQPVFYIYGEVQKPGAYPLSQKMTVRQAIAVGGGLTVRGTEHGLRISRDDKKGVPTIYRANLNDVLAPGDVLRIKESWF